MSKSNIKNAIGLIVADNEVLSIEYNYLSSRVIVKTKRNFPNNFMHDGVFTNIDSAIEFFAKFFKDNNLKSNNIIIGVRTQSILLRMANFQVVPDDKVKNTILFQSQQFIPIPINELVLDYVRYSDVIISEKPNMNVLLVGAKKEFINQLITISERLHYNLVGIDAELLSGVRACIDSLNLQNDKVNLLIDADNSNINITFLKNKEVMLSRSILIPKFQRNMQDFSEGDQTDINDTQNDANEINYMKNRIEMSVSNSISYFENNFHLSIEKIYLFGSIYCIEEIASYLNEKLQHTVTLPNLYPNFTKISSKEMLGYASCLGLLLGEGDLKNVK